MKKALIEQVISQLQNDLNSLLVAAQSASDAATHEENKAEDQYDTRGLEASYLAGAQNARVEQLESQLSLLKQFSSPAFQNDSPISSGALIEAIQDEKHVSFLLLPVGGGLLIKSADSKKIQIITPQSPLGTQLLGRAAGESFEVRVGPHIHECEILSVS